MTRSIGHPLSIRKASVFCGIPVLLDSSARDSVSLAMTIFRCLTKLTVFIASFIGIPRKSRRLSVFGSTPLLLASSARHNRSPLKSIFHDVERWLCCSILVAHRQFSLKYPRDESILSIDSPFFASPMSARKLLNNFHSSHTVIPFSPYAAKAGELGLRQRCSMLFQDTYVLLRVSFVLPPWPCFKPFECELHDREQNFPRPLDSFDG